MSVGQFYNMIHGLLGAGMCSGRPVGSAFQTCFQKENASLAKNSLFQKTRLKTSTASAGASPALNTTVVLGSVTWRVDFLGITNQSLRRSGIGYSRAICQDITASPRPVILLISQKEKPTDRVLSSQKLDRSSVECSVCGHGQAYHPSEKGQTCFGWLQEKGRPCRCTLTSYEVKAARKTL